MEIERRSIDFIPEEERHGSPKSLFTVWFNANMTVVTLVTGALGVTMGLNLFWCFTAIILGNLIGGIFMASHSAQGPQLGIPQMIQSRAQFGVIGAIFPIILVILMYVGFMAANGLLEVDTIKAVLPVSSNSAIIIASILTLIVTFIGYDFIHSMAKYLSIFSALIFTAVTILIISQGFPAGAWSPTGGVNFGTFMLFLSIAAAWQITYAPYVADYARYLPSNTPAKQTFGYTYVGSVLGTVWMMLLGALLGAAIPDFMDNASVNIASLFGPYTLIVYIVIFTGLAAGNVLNLYGAFMSTTTFMISIKEFKVTKRIKFLILFLAMSAGATIQIFGQGNFMAYYSNLVLLLQYFLLPWTAINLVDYYVMRRGKYSIPDIFDKNGIYGRYNWTSLFTYAATILMELPFMTMSFYEGFVSKAMGGADITWVIALTVPGLLYYLLLKNKVKIQNDQTSDAVVKS
ncbi:purine-cytosine permease family protein [Paenibacillus hodogayensis]|uniref:Purine-cytosine permease family protein n=1 Tax=Paenibacillus hodogayensis TaxID=279208 RepID=A0ABV5W121_9BACL